MLNHEDIIVEIDNRQNNIDITDDIKNIIVSCIDKALDMEKFDIKAMVSIALVDNPGIRKVNLEYRDVDKDTDVLSFPMLELKPGHRDLNIDDFKDDAEPDSGAVILGDIMISMEKVQEQSQEYGHSFGRELGFLVVHGILHLLGYDHMEQDDKDIMRSREEAILGALDLTRN